MMLLCVGDGPTLNIAVKVKDEKCVEYRCTAVWNILKDWFLDKLQKNTMIQYYGAKLKDLWLDISSTSTICFNHFKLLLQKLGNLKIRSKMRVMTLDGMSTLRQRRSQWKDDADKIHNEEYCNGKKDNSSHKNHIPFISKFFDNLLDATGGKI
eukprot:2931340-Ditylum_brightwellii.AAC.1